MHQHADMRGGRQREAEIAEQREPQAFRYYERQVPTQRRDLCEVRVAQDDQQRATKADGQAVGRAVPCPILAGASWIARPSRSDVGRQRVLVDRDGLRCGQEHRANGHDLLAKLVSDPVVERGNLGSSE